MLYDFANELAGRVLKTIEPHIVKGQIAGSIQRKKKQVHDVDIVIIPKPFTFTGVIPTTLIKELGAEILRSGPKILAVTIDGNQVDIYAANEQDWGIQILRWTGSKEHNIWLCNRAIDKGMKLAVSHGLEKEGKVIASRSEEDIFKVLELPWIEPAEREK